MSETFDAWKDGPRGNLEYLERLRAWRMQLPLANSWTWEPACRARDEGPTEMSDDLFRGITLSCHMVPFLVTYILTLGLGTF